MITQTREKLTYIFFICNENFVPNEIAMLKRKFSQLEYTKKDM